MMAERFTILYQKYVSETLSVEELHEWKQLIETEKYDDILANLISETSAQEFRVKPGEGLDPQLLFRKIIGNSMTGPSRGPAFKSIAMHVLRYAAILALVVFGIYLWNNRSEKTTGTLGNNGSAVSESVVVSRNRATLTLGDGRIINLDSAGRGVVANEAGIAIEKTGDGQIRYAHSDANSKEIIVNTIQTPNGSQYEIKLPDGSKVWLNALTSIRFPAVFETHQRKVFVKGEAYFEIAPDSRRPFIVELGSQRSVQVLGTAFNINNYADEPFFKTTLINGSVKVRSEIDSLILKQNQTVNITSHIKIDATANAMQQIAWKNGIFNFDGTDAMGLLRQISRWYDVNIVIEGKVPQKIFRGKLGRDLTIHQMMKVLKDFGMENRLEGNKLIIY